MALGAIFLGGSHPTHCCPLNSRMGHVLRSGGHVAEVMTMSKNHKSLPRNPIPLSILKLNGGYRGIAGGWS